MCRLAYEEGTRLAAATAHQNEHWPDVTPDRIRQATQKLTQTLKEAGIPLTVFPCAEIMVHPEIDQSWDQGAFLSVADRGQYLLLEMPHGLFVDLRAIVKRLHQAGVRPILAHPERHGELLHDPGNIEQLIQAGCLVQVSASSITHPANGRDQQGLKSWFRRGVVHLLGSDGHSVDRRPPRLRAAYELIARWAGVMMADRVSSVNGMAVLHGWPLQVSSPEPLRRSWFTWLFPRT